MQTMNRVWNIEGGENQNKPNNHDSDRLVPTTVMFSLTIGIWERKTGIMIFERGNARLWDFPGMTHLENCQSQLVS